MTATLVAPRDHGVLRAAGPPRRRARRPRLCDRDVPSRGPRGAPGLAGRGRRRGLGGRHRGGGDRSTAADPHRGAHGAELPGAAVGHRHPHGAVRRRRAREQRLGRGARHPKDHARPARAREGRRACRGRHQSPVRALRRRAGEGQPSGRDHHHRRRGTGPHDVARPDGGGRVRRASTRWPRRRGRAPMPSCSTTWTRARSSRPSPWRTSRLGAPSSPRSPEG